MGGPRVEALSAKLEKGRRKTHEILSALQPEEWSRCLYAGACPWTVRDLLAHFVSAETALLQLCQDTAVGGEGAPPDFDFEAFNAREQLRLADVTRDDLLTDLSSARQRTLDWLRSLSEEDLDRVGRHPGLGQVTLETMITAIYGHQLLHMRDLQASRS